MVHTYELSCVIDYNTYCKLVILSYPDKNNRHRYICNKLCHCGIEIKLYESVITGYAYCSTYRCYYKINPTRLYNENDYLGLFNTGKLIDTISKINDKLSELSESLPKVEECKLVRFDFCVNAEVPSRQCVEDIISLVNRNHTSLVAKNYKQTKEFNRKANRHSLPKHEATFTKYHKQDKECVEISIYDKAWQLSQFKTPQITDKKIVRCEIRCYRPYIKRLSKKFGCNNTTGFFLQAAKIEEYVFKWQLKKLGLNQDFVRLPEIAAIIEQSGYKSKTKRELVETAIAAANHRSLSASLSEMPIDEAEKMIKRFKNMGISAMPIPHNAAIPNFFNFGELIMGFTL